MGTPLKISQKFNQPALKTKINIKTTDAEEEDAPCRSFSKEATLSSSHSAVDDLIHLTPTSSDQVLLCLRARYSHNEIYTRAGSTLVSVNPFKGLPQLYGTSAMDEYHTATATSPHVYQVAQQVISRMSCPLDDIRNQSIIVSGESGAGKTVSAKHLIKYLVTVADKKPPSRDSSPSLKGMGTKIEQRILDSNPILEAFGNACTLRNENSSRFGKYIELQFSLDSDLLGASVQTYLLEKTRVAYQAEGEGTFHVFYQLLSGFPVELRDVLIPKDSPAFHLAPTHNRNKEQDAAKWRETYQALMEIGLSEGQRLGLFQVLAAILHLGNVALCHDPEDEDVCVVDELTSASLSTAGEVLDLDPGRIEKILTHRRISAAHRRRQSVFHKPCTLAESSARLHCLLRTLYAKVFDWLVDYINIRMQSRKARSSIGILDIYGFESFDSNSLEQLCINYANERLQQHFVRHFLRDLQDDYEREAISWTFTKFVDNQPCLDLLQSTPGIFALLNEECQLNRASDPENLQTRISHTLLGNRHLALSRKGAPAFIVKHYAQPVTYELEGMIDKNKDNVPIELIDLLQESNHSFLQLLFSQETIPTHAPGKKQTVVLSKFKASLDSLMASLDVTHPHYIRCIKPNSMSMPANFDPDYVMKQLTACGIAEAVEISKRAFPARMPYSEFLQTFSLLLNSSEPPSAKTQPEAIPNKENEEVYEPLELLYQRQLQLTPRRKSLAPRQKLRRRADVDGLFPGLSSADHTRPLCATILRIALSSDFMDSSTLQSQFGRTKVFFKQGQLEALLEMRNRALSKHAFSIQCAWRRYQSRNMKRILLIQAATRGWMARKSQRCRHRAAVVIQRAYRRHTTTKQTTPITQRIPPMDDFTDMQFYTPLVPTLEHFSTPPTSKKPPPPPSRLLPSHTPLPSIPDEYVVDKEIDEDGVTYHISPSPRRRLRESRTASDAYHAVALAISASFVNQGRFRLAGAFTGMPYFEAQNGILSRRRMPRVKIRFHTRPNPVLRNGHIMSNAEFRCSLADCLDFE